MNTSNIYNIHFTCPVYTTTLHVIIMPCESGVIYSICCCEACYAESKLVVKMYITQGAFVPHTPNPNTSKGG